MEGRSTSGDHLYIPSTLSQAESLKVVYDSGDIMTETARHDDITNNNQIELNRVDSEGQDVELVDLQATNVTNREDVPPDGGYGWICTVCMFLINAHTWGVNSVSLNIHFQELA